MRKENENIEVVEEDKMDITVVEKESFFSKVKNNKVVKPILATVGIGLLTIGAFALGRTTGHDDDEEYYDYDVVDSNDDASEE